MQYRRVAMRVCMAALPTSDWLTALVQAARIAEVRLAGAHTSAVIYSLVQIDKSNGLEPYQWLRRVLRDLPATRTVEKMETLLPWNLPMSDLTS
jgi:hypothetical protein